MAGTFGDKITSPFLRSLRQQHHQHVLWRSVSSTKVLCHEESYIDKWFESIAKPQHFYDDHADGDVRRYFYNIDLQGRLFLEETIPKNIATSIKDNKFLNFFFSRIRRVRPADIDFLKETGYAEDYPFVSLCGKEINFIRPAATPIVFHSLGNDVALLYGGDLVVAFDPSLLALSEATGRLYHKLHAGDGKKKKNMVVSELGYGLIRSSVAVSLSDHIVAGDEGEWVYATDDGPIPIKLLPADYEPGVWALPG